MPPHVHALVVTALALERGEFLLDGEIARQDFTAYYVRGGQVLAAGGCGRSRQMCALAELMRLGRTPTADAVRGGSPDFVRMLGKV